MLVVLLLGAGYLLAFLVTAGDVPPVANSEGALAKRGLTGSVTASSHVAPEVADASSLGTVPFGEDLLSNSHVVAPTMPTF